MDSRTHGLQTGQSVLFREVHGMDELNGTARQITGTARLLHTYHTHTHTCEHAYSMLPITLDNRFHLHMTCFRQLYNTTGPGV